MAKEITIAREGARAIYQYENIARESPPRSLSTSSYEAIDTRFEKHLAEFTVSNADRIIFDLGRPSQKVLSAGVPDKSLRLYRSKLLKKMRVHGFDKNDLQGLTQAVRDPIAVFQTQGNDSSFAILTTLQTKGNNFLVALRPRKGGADADLILVSSVYGKGRDNVVRWVNNGNLRYVDKVKALNYLHSAAPIAAASDNQGLISAAKIIENFKNNK